MNVIKAIYHCATTDVVLLIYLIVQMVVRLLVMVIMKFIQFKFF